VSRATLAVLWNHDYDHGHKPVTRSRLERIEQDGRILEAINDYRTRHGERDTEAMLEYVAQRTGKECSRTKAFRLMQEAATSKRFLRAIGQIDNPFSLNIVHGAREVLRERSFGAFHVAPFLEYAAGKDWSRHDQTHVAMVDDAFGRVCAAPPGVGITAFRDGDVVGILRGRCHPGTLIENVRRSVAQRHLRGFPSAADVLGKTSKERRLIEAGVRLGTRTETLYDLDLLAKAVAHTADPGRLQTTLRRAALARYTFDPLDYLRAVAALARTALERDEASDYLTLAQHMRGIAERSEYSWHDLRVELLEVIAFIRGQRGIRALPLRPEEIERAFEELKADDPTD
jgi:hypothetical protein